MGGHARDAFRLSAGRPRRQVGNRCRRAGGQFFDGGIAAAGIGLVHELVSSNSAHRSPYLLTPLALLAETILRATSPRQFGFVRGLSYCILPSVARASACGF